MLFIVQHICANDDPDTNKSWFHKVKDVGSVQDV